MILKIKFKKLRISIYLKIDRIANKKVDILFVNL